MQQNNRKMINGKSIILGTCYYPEQWDKKLWAEDIDRMLAAGIQESCRLPLFKGSWMWAIQVISI